MKLSLLVKKTLLGSACVGLLALAPVTFNFDDGAFTYNTALAKNDNSNNGKGRGNSSEKNKGNSGQNASASASANSNANNGNGLGNNRGSLSSALGRLNAAHASENALANASAKSVVGTLAQYRDAVQASSLLTERLNEISEIIQGLEDQIASYDIPTLTALSEQLNADALAASEAQELSLDQIS